MCPNGETVPKTDVLERMTFLGDPALIRLRPAMYIGNILSTGLHNLVFDIVFNAVDEAVVGFCKNILLQLHVDGSVSVIDDGRGIPVEILPELRMSTLEKLFTISGCGGAYGGAQGVRALSEWLEAEVCRNGRVYRIEFERGQLVSALADVGPAPANQTSTTITFKPDTEIFADINFSYDTLRDRFRELAFLNKGLALSIIDEREDGKSETFKFDSGIAEYVADLNQREQVDHLPIYIHKLVEKVAIEIIHRDPDPVSIVDISVEVALQYSNSGDERIRCYTNNAYNPVGGTHFSGFRAGITRALRAYGRKEGHFKEGLEFKSEDFRGGFTAVVSIRHPAPLFMGSTRLSLGNPEVSRLTSSIVYEFFTKYLETNPKEATRICERVVHNAEARIAAKNERLQAKRRVKE